MATTKSTTKSSTTTGKAKAETKTTKASGTTRKRTSTRKTTTSRKSTAQKAIAELEALTNVVSAAVEGDYSSEIPVPGDNTVKPLADGLRTVFADASASKERLAETEAQLQAINQWQAVIEFHPDGTIITANDNFQAVTEWALDEIEGKHHRLFVDEEYANSSEYKQFWDDLARGDFKTGEFKRQTKSGNVFWIHGSYCPLKDAQGNVTKVVKYASDITASKLAFEENQRIKSMMERSAAMIFADPECTIQYMNPAALKTLRGLEEHLPVRADEIVGQSIDVFHKNPAHQRNILADPSNLPITTNINVGPETLELTVNAVFDDDKNYLGGMVTWEVVTAKLEMERKIREKSEEDARNAEETRHKADQILDLVNRMADGQFDMEFPDLGDDALGQVSEALTRAVVSVRSALTEVRDVSTTVATASNEMTSASEEISKGAQQQAASLEETASSLEEITNTVKQNSENAQEARALANGSRDVATEGGKVVGDAVTAMREINDSSKKISDIITTIDEIAFQTNLLALNAAVEAARAGEQGRGFAVVAAEVRNLAQRSASSAKEIKGLIEDSAAKVERGTDLVNKSGETLGGIVDSVKRVTDIVSEIAAASQEQLTAIEQVTKAVTQMDQVTQANASQTEELAGTSSSVLNHAKQLDAMVSRFQLGTPGVHPGGHAAQGHAPAQAHHAPGQAHHAPAQGYAPPQGYAAPPNYAASQNPAVPHQPPVTQPQYQMPQPQAPQFGCPQGSTPPAETDEFMEF